MERKFQKYQNILTWPTHFLPYPKTVHKSKNVPKQLFLKYDCTYTVGPKMGQNPTEDWSWSQCDEQEKKAKRT